MALKSYRSPSVSVIGSPSSLEALVFFWGPVRSVLRGHFSCVDVVLGSMPSTMSSVPYPVVRFGPLSSCVMVAPVSGATATFSVALVCSVAAFTASREALISLVNCSLCFYCASSLVASLCFCIIVSSRTARSRACHLGVHELRTTNIASSIVMKGSWVQFYSRSFHALI